MSVGGSSKSICFFVFFQSSLNGNDSFKPQESENDDHEGKSEARLLDETLAQGWAVI